MRAPHPSVCRREGLISPLQQGTVNGAIQSRGCDFVVRALGALRCVFMAMTSRESLHNYDVEMERLAANKSLQSIINTIVMCGQATPLFMFILWQDPNNDCFNMTHNI